jgi:hypothetical protein
MGKSQGIVVGVVAAALGVLVAQPLAGTAAVLPQHLAGATAPSLSVPSATVPSVSTPKIATTAVSTPSVTTPEVSAPSVTTPSVTTPEVSAPSVTTPSATTPSVTTPSVTTPKVSTPSVSSPVGTVPSAPTPSVASAASGVVRTTASNVASGLSAATGRASTPQGTGGPVSGASDAGTASSSTPATGSTTSASDAPALTASDRTSALRAVGLGTGSLRARRLAIARENRRLRRLVARLRGCLAALDPGARRLLDLRAGVDGPAHSARATARILHISLRREAIRERRALRALTRSGATGCDAGQPTGVTPGVTTAGLPLLSATPPSGVTATPAKHTSQRASRASYSSDGPAGGSANIAPSRARTEKAEASGSFPSAILTALLGLLLALAMVVAPKLRRRPATAAGGLAAASRGARVTQAGAPATADRGPRAQTSAARRPITQVVKPTDPAIAPMAADAYATMAGDDEGAAEHSGVDEAEGAGPDAV